MARKGSTTQASDNGLLVSLGKIAGIGGIALGIFFLLYRSFLAQRFMSSLKLESGQGYRLLLLFMLLTFAVAIVGLTIWASQQKTGRQVSILLLVFALALAGLGSWLIVSDMRAPPPTTVAPSQGVTINIRDSNLKTYGSNSDIRVGTPPGNKTDSRTAATKSSETSTQQKSKGH